jgi:Arc/MetJ-type ribon-helix-helix transcriptional regulator
MRTRDVVLTKHQEKIIEALVGSSRCQIASEVLREAAGLVERFHEVAVGTPITERPPHRTVRARFGHTAPTLGV